MEPNCLQINWGGGGEKKIYKTEYSHAQNIFLLVVKTLIFIIISYETNKLHKGAYRNINKEH